MSGEPMLSLVRRLRERNAQIEIFVVANQAERITRRFPLFAKSGVDRAFELDVEQDRVEFAELTRRRLGAPPPAEELRQLAERTKGLRVAPLALSAVRNGFLHLSCRQVELLFGCDRKTLYRWTMLDLESTLGDLLKFGRQLHARRLRAEGFSLSAIAHLLGYGTASGVAMLIHRGQGSQLRGRRQLMPAHGKLAK